MTKKDEAIAAIKAANPRWSENHCKLAYELMPTTTAWAYEKGTSDRLKAEQYFLSKWTKWAIEMNLMPEDTVIPDHPVELPQARTTRVSGEPIKIVTQQGINAPKPGTMAKQIWDQVTNFLRSMVAK